MKTSRINRLLALVMAFAMVFSLASVASAASDASSVELVVSAPDNEMSVRAAFSPAELALMVGITLAENGTTTSDMDVYLSAQSIAFTSALLEKSYGINLPKMAENLSSSVFAPDSGSQYAMDQESFDEIIGALSGISSAVSQQEEAAAEIPDQLPVDVEALTSSISALVPAFSQAIEAASQNMSMQSSTGTVTVNGTEVNVQTVKMQYGTEAIAALYDSLLTSIAADEAAQDAVAVLVDLVNTAVGGNLGTSGEELVQTIVEQNEELRASLAEGFAETDMNFEITVSVDQETSTPVEMGIQATIDGETAALRFQLSEDGSYIRADVTADGETASVVYTLAENSEDAMSFRVDVVSGTETVAVTFVQNKKNQTFDLTYSQVTADETYSSTYSGSYTVSDNLFSLVLDKIDGEEFGGTVTLNLRSQDTLTVPAFTELLQLGEEEMTAAMTELLGSVQSVAEIFS